MSDTLTEGLLRRLEEPDATAYTLVSTNGEVPPATVTFHEVTRRGLRVADELRDAGIGRGDRVVLAAGPSPNWVASFVGILFAGGIAAPVNHTYREREFVAAIQASTPTVVLVDGSARTEVVSAAGLVSGAPLVLDIDAVGQGRRGAAAPDSGDHFGVVIPDVDDPALILHTSGTTGRPKGVVRTQGQCAKFLALWGREAMNERERVLNFLPLYHQAGLMVSLLPAFLAGRPTYHLDRFSVDGFWNIIDQYDLTWTVVMQPVPRYLLDAPRREDDRDHTLEWVLGTTAPDEWIALQDRFGFAFHSSYGSTETTIVRITGLRNANPVPAERIRDGRGGALCGAPIDAWGEVRVADDDGEPAAPGELGMIHVSGEPLFREYFGDAEATRAAWTADGWFRSGDVGYFAPTGDLYMVDRITSLIRRSGENISPREIEALLEEHPAIAEAAVVGVPDALRGQEIGVCIVLHAGCEMTADDVFDYCRQNLAAFKVPRYVDFRETLPRTPTFKVQKDALDIDIWTDRVRIAEAAE